MVHPLTLKNAVVYGGSKPEPRDLYLADVLLDKPNRKSLTVDLSGYVLFPGMINAHDHLELNHFPRTKFRERYDNAHQWGEDVSQRLDQEPFKTLRAYPLEDRCFIGGLKNLLCGALTVVHHNPPHKPLFRSDFPVTVPKRYGWVHSLHFSTEAEIVASYQQTPPDIPWFIHLAEGTDATAASEYRRLKKLGCVGKNTRFIHGVGITDADSYDGNLSGAKLITCPTTNLYLLGQSVYPSSAFLTSLTMLGSDSRLTAEGDLLDELRAFHTLYPLIPNPFSYVYHAPELHLALRPHKFRREFIWWDAGDAPDFFLIKHDYELTKIEALVVNARRADLALIVRGGVPQIGDPDLMAQFPHIETVRAELDGVPKAINVQLARQIAKCTLQEPGLTLIDNPQGRRRTLW